MKRLALSLVTLVAVAFAIGVCKDALLKVAIEKGVGKVTGMQLSMGSFKAGVVNPVIQVKDLLLSNPVGFREAVMIDMPEIYISYDLTALAKKKLRVRNARIDLREFTVERSADGKMNFDSLKKALDRKAGERSAGGAALPEVTIDRLNLKIGKVVFRDQSKKPPAVKEFPVNIDEEFTDITDVKMLGELLVARALLSSGVYKLANIDPAELRAVASQITQIGMAKAAQQASQLVTHASDGTRSQAVRQAADAVQDALKMFGAGDEK